MSREFIERNTKVAISITEKMKKAKMIYKNKRKNCSIR